MTEREAITPAVNATNVKPPLGQRILKFVVLIGISVGVAISATYGITIWQEIQQRQTWMAVTEGGAGGAAGPFTAENPPSPDNFAPRQVVSPYTPITEVPVSTVEEAEAAENKIDDDELVLGVVVNDEARAYPINMLTGPSREIVNDILGGRAIAATW